MSVLLSSVSTNKKPMVAVSLLLFLFAMLTYVGVLHAQHNDNGFIVVLDAGHGGHDPGNLGNGHLEKNIALNIVLHAGTLLERTPGIKVLYTRKDDTFVDLYVRGEIANKANADLFVSVHCDSHSSQAHGAGTFVLGLHANKQNFEIAKKENSVIYLEDNYETRYADYDINSPESVIGLTIMQEEFLDQSIALAKSIQQNFGKKLNRKDRKVKQAGFIVLHQTFMPSVLVETGFLTNKAEGAYLNSKKGQTEMGKAIAQAVVMYREGVRSGNEQPTNSVSAPVPNPEEIASTEKKTAVKGSNVNSKDAAGHISQNPGSRPISKKAEGKSKAQKVAEKEVSEPAAAAKKEVVMDADTTEETMVATTDDFISNEEPPVKQEVTLFSKESTSGQAVKKAPPEPRMEEPKVEVKKEAALTTGNARKASHGIIFKVQLMASSKDIPLVPSNFEGLNRLSKEPFKKFHRYMYGSTASFDQAKLLKSNADAKGYLSSFIVAYKNGLRIPTIDALKLVSEY